MATETEQLRLSVELIDPASEQLKKLRGEMENLSGGAVSVGLEKTRQHAEMLVKQFIPLLGGLQSGASVVKTLIGVLPPLGGAVAGIGAAAIAAAANFERYRRSLADLNAQARELNVAASSLKKVEQEWKRAGMSEPQREANKAAIARAMGDLQNQGSELTKSLQALMFMGTETERKAVESLMGALRTGAYEEAANAIKETGDVIYNETLKLTGSAVEAAQRRNKFWELIKVEGFYLPMQKIVKATQEEIDDLKKQIKQWGEFGKEIRRSRVAVENINIQLFQMTAQYEPIVASYRVFADYIKRLTTRLKTAREKRQTLPTIEPNWRDLLPDVLRKRLQPEVQRQSYSSDRSFGGVPIILASYQDSSEKLRDDVRETVILTEQFRILNSFLRGTKGGSAAIRASLGVPPGGGGGGYGPSGIGTRGTGAGQTGSSTTPPTTGPPSVPGMPGVRPGDVGVAAMLRAGTPRRDLLSSLQPTTPGGPRPISVSPSLAGGGAGVAGMIQEGVVGGSGGGVPAGAGPIPGVGQVQPRLRMPELPRGVPHGGLREPLTSAYGSPEAAVDEMLAMLGKSETNATDRAVLLDYINSGGKQTTDVRGRSNAWCAYFVNAALTRQGIVNPRNPAAGSYKNVGARVSAEQANKGDIFLVPGSGGAMGGIAHVGFVTGPLTKDGLLPTVSGNTPFETAPEGGVGQKLYDPRKIIIRRLPVDPSVVKQPAGVAVASVTPSGQAEGGAPEDIKHFIRAKEGFTPRAESDYGAVSFGYGTASRGRTSITKEQALKESNEVADQAWREVNQRWPNAPYGVKKALTSLEYNSGFTRKDKPRAIALRGALDRGDYAEARRLFLESHHVTHTKGGVPISEVPMSGLKRRRAEEIGFWDEPANKAASPSSPAAKRDSARSITDSEIIVPNFAESKKPAKPFIKMDTAGIDRALGGEVKSKVNGDGEIEVDVKGPSGTKVTAETPKNKSNIFKRTSVNRVKEAPEEKKEKEKEPVRTASRTDEE